MDLLKQLKRLGTDGRRWLRRPGSVTWAAPFNGGVAVALEPGTAPDSVRIAVRMGDAPERAIEGVEVFAGDGAPLLVAPLPRAGAGSCTLSVQTGGRTHRQSFVLGPGRYAGRIEGVRDYGLEGWVSPLFPCDTPRVQLVIDGEAGEPVPLDRFRRFLMAGGEGGWNAFRLPLPPRVLDGSEHRLGVRAGETLLDLGSWRARPKFHIETAGSDGLSGWYFDRSAEDAPTTLRIVTDGITRASATTHARADLRAAFGRGWASFAFEEPIEPGSLLVAGPEGSGRVVGRVGSDLLGRIGAHRAEARAALLGSDGRASERAALSLARRRALRARIHDVERRAPTASIAFQPGAAAGSAPSFTPGEAVRPTVQPPPVCAIVPVYDGLADLRLCLAALLPQLALRRVRAILIDDASPDPEVGRYLAELESRRYPGLTIVRNAQNLGFIATVNRGLAMLARGEDALLLNADTVLPPGAVERLARHCHVRPGIASVTPMSNTATILSFPSTTEHNPAPLGLDAAALDAAFAGHGAEPVEIPTGVGFCMHLNRAALDEVGPLSLDWGRGYCEEVEWCLTARDLGWVHLAATDTFVMHEGSVSFTPAARLALLAVNHARLEALYPDYVPELEAFTRADPLEPLREAVLLRLLAGRFARLTLHLTHGFGGGTKRFIADLCALPRAPEHEVAVLRPVDTDGEDRRWELSLDRAGVSLTLKADRIEPLLAGLEARGVAVALHVHARLFLTGDVLAGLLDGRRPYAVTLHDFQWYCPRVNLTDGRRFYCGEPPPQVCQICVARDLDYDFADQAGLIQSDMPGFLAFNARLLRGASALLAPSHDTAGRYARRFGLTDIAVVPHPEPDPKPVPDRSRRARNPGAPLHVAVVGAIAEHKGYEILLRLCEQAARERAPLFLTVIGHTIDTPRLLRFGNAAVTGLYAPEELPRLLAETDPDLVFLPSVWPETYSYVLSEIREAGYPTVAFDLGAPAERIRAEGGGHLIPPTRDAKVLLDALLALGDPPALTPVPRPPVLNLEAYYRACGF
ncbi:glycosyltransferase [Methylobacterium radiodurans]|uniref:glycosyltransferase n=1 Tax=Methylobacterium radiodurans TaxID=2202828 RepID=UPI0013A55744|nr:glycosyltransferase [Methylobacterium radiodurans]